MEASLALADPINRSRIGIGSRCIDSRAPPLARRQRAELLSVLSSASRRAAFHGHARSGGRSEPRRVVIGK